MGQRAYAPAPQRRAQTIAASLPAAPVQSRNIPEQEPIGQAQIERATRFGHHFGRVRVSPPASGAGAAEPIQTRAAEMRPPGQHLAPAGRGRSLPEALQGKMERAYGQDFSGVRVHEGGAAESIGAMAFTRGENIHFAPGQYRPASRAGQELIGHELAHVVQQRAGRVSAPQGKGAPINSDPALEAEADTQGARAANGGKVSMVAPQSAPIMRSERTAPVRSDRASATTTGGPEGTIQCNKFLSSLADKHGKIDYNALAQSNYGDGQALHEAIQEPVEKMVRRQATLQALEQAGLGTHFKNYAQNQNVDLGGLVAMGQDVRSSHSGGAIDPLLPQPAYEKNPIAGVSVAPPALTSLADRANYDHLSNTTETHTIDPQGLANVAKNPSRVASYMELTAGSVNVKGKKAVSGTRVVFDPFNNKHYISDHYEQQFELTNVPSPTSHPKYQQLTSVLTQAKAKPAYKNGTQAQKDTFLHTKVYPAFLEHMYSGKI